MTEFTRKEREAARANRAAEIVAAKTERALHNTLDPMVRAIGDLRGDVTQLEASLSELAVGVLATGRIVATALDQLGNEGAALSLADALNTLEVSMFGSPADHAVAASEPQQPPSELDGVPVMAAAASPLILVP